MSEAEKPEAESLEMMLVEPEVMAAGDTRHHEAYKLKMKGVKVATIASLFKVSERTCFRWFRTYEAEFRESMESVPAANLIAQQLCELYAQRDAALAEAANCVTRRDKNAFMRTALNAQGRIIDLMLSTGVLPKAPEKLYAKVEDSRPSFDAAGAERAERTLDEIKDSILDLLSRPRTVQ